jgi:hypothetical protein
VQVKDRIGKEGISLDEVWGMTGLGEGRETESFGRKAEGKVKGENVGRR